MALIDTSLNKMRQSIRDQQHDQLNRIKILDIPLITDIIEKCCSTNTMFILSSVSKTWRSIWLPYIYKRKFKFKKLVDLQVRTVETTESFMDWISIHGPYLLDFEV